MVREDEFRPRTTVTSVWVPRGQSRLQKKTSGCRHRSACHATFVHVIVLRQDNIDSLHRHIIRTSSTRRTDIVPRLTLQRLWEDKA